MYVSCRWSVCRSTPTTVDLLIEGQHTCTCNSKSANSLSTIPMLQTRYLLHISAEITVSGESLGKFPRDIPYYNLTIALLLHIYMILMLFSYR